MRTFARALVVLVVVCALAPVARPFVERGWFLYTLATQEPATTLPNPVKSKRPVALFDSWGNPRSGGRRHQGIDIFAAKGTPVTSTTAGMIMGVGTNNLGGKVVWVLGPGLERHYYAHLSRYGAFRPGDRVESGAIIGYAGNTGNARGGPVHLHYGIYRAGAAQDPYPRLAAGARAAAAPLPRPRVTAAKLVNSDSPIRTN